MSRGSPARMWTPHLPVALCMLCKAAISHTHCARAEQCNKQDLVHAHYNQEVLSACLSHMHPTAPSLRMQALSTTYDVDELQRFFAGRPLLVWQRLGSITWRFSTMFVRSFLRSGRSGLTNPPGDELTALLATLGPTFVKLGQTLSTREDLIGRDVARTLSSLQMAAPPFDDATAFAVMRDQLHGDPRQLYERISETPVAAASLGQVYKGAVDVRGTRVERKASAQKVASDADAQSASGTWDVAVKVQRPDLLGSIALDVYVLRLALGVVRRLAGINSDIRKIADEVGRGLFAELDYRVEASQVRRAACAVCAALKWQCSSCALCAIARHCHTQAAHALQHKSRTFPARTLTASV